METIRTPERAVAFLAVLADTGIVTAACKATGICRSAAYQWRTDDADFAKRWDEAAKLGGDAWEDELARRAFHGVDEPVVHQGMFTPLIDYEAIDPDTGKPFSAGSRPIKVDADGKPILATVKKYSDTLGIFMLKGLKPDKYRDRSDVNLNARHSVRNMSDEEIAKEIAELDAALNHGSATEPQLC